MTSTEVRIRLRQRDVDFPITYDNIASTTFTSMPSLNQNQLSSYKENWHWIVCMIRLSAIFFMNEHTRTRWLGYVYGTLNNCGVITQFFSVIKQEVNFLARNCSVDVIARSFNYVLISSSRAWLERVLIMRCVSSYHGIRYRFS